MATKTGKASQTEIDLMKSHSKILVSNLEKRKAMFDEIEQIYFMQDSNLPTEDWVKETISPEPRNALQSAWRLLVATDPQWDCPEGANNDKLRAIASSIEKFATATWFSAGRARKKPIHYDAALTALLYGEVHLRINSTKALAEMGGSPGRKLRAEKLARVTPLLFDVLNPKIGYPEFDNMGLAAYYTTYETNALAIRTLFGDIADKMLGDAEPDRVLTFNEYWNDTLHGIWLSEFEETPLVSAIHNLDTIPFAVQLMEGSEMFTEEDQETRHPFLYSVWKSGFANRLNLSLTAIYSMLYSVVANAQFLYERNAPDKQLDVTTDIPGGLITIDAGEKFGPLAKNAIDPALIESLKIAESAVTNSTIYKQTLGEPLGANAPFGMVSLLHQAGRLPLVPYQRMLNMALADAMKIGIEMIKAEGGRATKKVLGADGMVELDFKNVPEVYELQANLDINLPQDERQNVVMATQASYGPDPLVSKNYARRSWLKIRQPDDMQKEIVAEQAANVLAQAYIQQVVAQAQAQAQQGLQPGGVTGFPPTPSPNGPGQQGPPAEVMNSVQGKRVLPETSGLPGLAPGQDGSMGAVPSTGGGMPNLGG